MSRRSSHPAARLAVRSVATAALAAAIVVPAMRRRWRVPAPVTLAVAVGGPLSVTVLRPRSSGRDVVLFVLQMWGFAMAHELPYDDPLALRRRLRIHYPIAADRRLGGGELPTARLQRALSRPGEVTTLDRALSLAHWAWFFQPHAALLWVLLRHPERFPRAARQMAATYDVGCAIYFLVPTAPPWWAVEEGYLDSQLERVRTQVAERDLPPAVRRIMVDVGEQIWGRAWPRLYDSLGGNPWAAMPSLHFATSLMAALHLAETGRVPGAMGWGYALTLAFALVYLGEHYVTDLVAGAAVVGAVRRAEPLAEPGVAAVNQVLQRLERVAGG